ncbi:nitrate- and nitrite sensing domain-containing protein [Kitasatospora sp. NPDC051914]|uniref:nitrate- and nitrite sensing domain-containing protein n=1 Tax=Kitasatospora sp. NPDC051914 TaxID=3154945 RepID=UPI003425F4F9
MRLRSSSIRAKIIALLMVPIVALTGLWVYATLVTTGDVRSQFDVSSTFKDLVKPVDRYTLDLQEERRTAVLRLADPSSQANKDAYEHAQAATDHSLRELRYLTDTKATDRLDAQQRVKYQDILTAAEQLPAIRGQAGREVVGWDHELLAYSDLVETVFPFRSSFAARQSGQLPRQSTLLTELVRAREYLACEAAAMQALRLTDQPGPEMIQIALDNMHSQQALFSVYAGELDLIDQRDYADLRSSDSWMALAAAEANFDSAVNRPATIRANPKDPWREAATPVLASFSDLNTRLADRIGERASSYALNQIVRGAVAGAIGLIAVVLSVLISYRIGRSHVRELIALRNAAQELSGTRLPQMMVRLRRGETVDVAAETPELEFGPAEIGQVGRAFHDVQVVAVEAVVEQAELRRGVSAVFVNLARRSQVLLHRQLTLLDAMERRTENPAELEDLFRLDHLTTRMRRHSEGLIILSGGSPGRAWRKPVRMVDVVRASVGEVEDYARVIVRPFPGTGLLGSAVADVTHLVAELIENATVFSPPHTQVTVQGEVVAHGFCLEIDDRGLGLSEHALEEINQRLAVEQEFDLADTDRLGLFVVSRLARRHGIRVHMRPSPYGGSTAVVLIPRELLADANEVMADQFSGRPAADAGRPAPVPAAAQQAAAPAVKSGRARSAPRIGGGPRPSAAEQPATPGGLPRRRSGGPALVPDLDAGTGRHRRPDGPVEQEPPAQPAAAAPAPAADPGRPAAAPAAAAEQVAGGLLPRRVRQASLAPQLREDGDRPAADPVRERSPEEARAAFASFQRGFARGRGDRLQPASLTVVPDLPDTPGPPPGVARPVGGPVRPRVALPSAPVPPALPAARPRPQLYPVRQGKPVPPAPPAPAEGTEQ